MYQMVTKKGYDFFEVSSAFQKAVRRGDQETALYFGIELDNSNYDEYLWKRIRIITSEDIGLAEPLMPAVIQSLYQSYQELKKKKDEKHKPERLFLIHAILLIVNAKKSRMVDWALCVGYGEHDNIKKSIPDYAYDMHTRKGKSLGHGIDHFYSEGCELSNHCPVDGEQSMMDRSKVIDKEESKGMSAYNTNGSLFDE